MKRVGGRWLEGPHKQVDGDKFVCLDKIITQPDNCLIYSFGIADDWTFEDLMASIGIRNVLQ